MTVGYRATPLTVGPEATIIREVRLHMERVPVGSWSGPPPSRRPPKPVLLCYLYERTRDASMEAGSSSWLVEHSLPVEGPLLGPALTDVIPSAWDDVAAMERDGVVTSNGADEHGMALSLEATRRIELSLGLFGEYPVDGGRGSVALEPEVR